MSGEAFGRRACEPFSSKASRRYRTYSVALTLAVSLGAAAGASAQPNACPPGFNDTPALSTHLSQTDIGAGKLSFKKIFDFGRKIFITNFNKCDGAGRPGDTGGAGVHGVGTSRTLDPISRPRFSNLSGPDSSSCASCHNEPEVGGAGSFRSNLLVGPEDCDPIAPLFLSGSIFAFPTPNTARECRPFVRSTTSTGFFNLFADRGSLGLFGSGAIELLSREMTDDLQNQQSNALAQALSSQQDVVVQLATKGVQFGQLTAHPNGTVDTSGVQGVSPDLVVRPMGRKGANKSIRHFALTAFNRHLGIQPDEALEQVPGVEDPDQDGVTGELTVGDTTAVMIFQAALPVPQRAKLSGNDKRVAARGEMLFSQVGCAGCHRPSLPLNSTVFCEPNPRNNDGDFRDTSQSFCFDLRKTSGLKGNLVEAFTDLKRHTICDPTRDYDPVTNHYCDDPPRLQTAATDKTGPGPAGVTDRPPYYQFLTAKLWDTGNSGPWGHRNDVDTLYEAIVFHGGEATDAVNAFEALADPDQLAVVKFLQSLKMPIMKNNPSPQEEGSPTAPNPGGN
jgi:hypothetical protein